MKRKIYVFIFSFTLLICAHQLFAQENTEKSSPTDSYRAAFEPYNATRSQPNDLTDADRFALNLGMTRAYHDCAKLSTKISAFENDEKELFSLGQLCIFGKQYEMARVALVRYLTLPQQPKREQALVLLTRTFLGLNTIESAAAQVRTLLLVFPYDASIHSVINEVIDRTEGESGYLNKLTEELCVAQSTATLPLLQKAADLDGAQGKLTAASLFIDAMRCSSALRNSTKLPDINALAAIAQEPAWKVRSDLPSVQRALDRQKMVGAPAPLSTLRGSLVGSASMKPANLTSKNIPVMHDNVLLVFFTLWSASTPDALREIAKRAPQQMIYAISSWGANTGSESVHPDNVLDGIRAWKQAAPKNVQFVLVPDAVINSFHVDTYPTGVLIKDGIVRANTVLTGEGDVRVLLNASHK